MGRRLRVGSVVVDCTDFPAMLAFWQAALGYSPRDRVQRGWAVLRDPGRTGPNLSLNEVARKTPGRNNLHLDLYTDDREREVERLLGLGAKRHRQAYSPTDDFRVLEDPDGNLFCVVQLPKRIR